MTMARHSLILAAMLCTAAVTAMSRPASAQTYGENYPVCLQVYAPIQYIACRYNSIPQCQATASGLGAMCVENPFFMASSPPLRRKRQR